MTTPLESAESHLDDCELGRYLDRECEPAERERVEMHLAACAACSTTLEAARAWSAGFSELLVGADLPAPRLPSSLRATDPAPVVIPVRGVASSAAGRSSRSAYLKAAAIVVVAIGASLSAAPVRAWVVERWAELRPTVAEQRTGEDRRDLPSGTLEGAVVSFGPVGDDFLLEFDALPTEGTLSIRVEEVQNASVQVVHGTGNEELMVLARGVRVRNTAGPGGDYRVVLPRSLRMLRVRIGGGEPYEYPLEQYQRGEEMRMPLAAVAP